MFRRDFLGVLFAMLFGFNREHARTLKGIARRDGLAPRAGTTVKYPKPLIDEHYIALGKPDANIAANASGTISIWAGTPGSETDTGENVTAYTRAALTSGKWVSVTKINGHLYAGCYQV
jgi:hypothetical protein